LVEVQMSERGGTTTQSGILYQNSVAALYVGRLCDSTSRPDTEAVVKVRVEAPEHVDDIVVTFADSHKAYLQCKERVRSRSEAWSKLWRDFSAQFQEPNFRRGKDRLLLHIGESRDDHHDLQEACERASHSESSSEWRARLAQSQRSLVEKIKPHLRPELLNEKTLLEFFNHIDVEIWPLKYIERDLVPHWMPESNEQEIKLFRLLRDRVGAEARHRGTFTADLLREHLQTQNVQLIIPPDIRDLRASLRECGALLRQHKHTIGSKGTYLKRAVTEEIISWIKKGGNGETVAMLLDKAGMGKTVVMREVLHALEEIGITTLAIKADQQLSGISSYEDIQKNLRLPDSVERVILRVAAAEPVVVILDQIDVLSLSLARDDKALNLVLDLIAQLRLISGVRILLSCRTFDRNNDPRLKRTRIEKEFLLTPLSDEEIKQGLREVNINFDKLSPSTKELLRNPLHLDLFVLALEGQAQSTVVHQKVEGVASLQELYSLLWRNVILKPEPDSPPTSEREEVLRLMTEYRGREQTSLVPQSVFSGPDTIRLQQAVVWLASAGVLIPGADGWSFLHQTFYDYCYAKWFVESGKHLAEYILNSDQGLYARPQMIHVLSYMRSGTPTYLRELNNLLTAQNLRPHLRHLLSHWFGDLPDPTDDELIIARRILVDPVKRPAMLTAMRGNVGWFAKLNVRRIEDLLLHDDETLDNQIIPYLTSLIDIAQPEIINLVLPYKGRSAQWNNRIASMMLSIRNWQTVGAIDLLEEVLRAIPALDRRSVYRLSGVAKAQPQIGCRLIRLLFDKIIEGHQAEQEDGASVRVALSGNLELNQSSTLAQTLSTLSQTEPKLFIITLLPWLERVVRLTSDSAGDSSHFGLDALRYRAYGSFQFIQHPIVKAFVTALSAMAREEPQEFRPIAARLESLPYKTPQELLAHVFKAVPEICAEDALRFLTADPRRLNLGEREQYQSRQMIEAICPFLPADQLARLEAAILAYEGNWKRYGVKGLQRQGLEQLYLLQSIPVDCLTPRGARRLQELKHKFPRVKASEESFGMVAVLVGSPIPEENARKMSDRAWLRAMEKYHDDIAPEAILKGGAHQLSSVLLRLVKEDPERFYRLLSSVPSTVAEPYVGALVNGLADSDCPPEWLFDAVRLFEDHPGRNIKQLIATALQKRADSGLPPDLVNLLESYLRQDHQEPNENHAEPYDGYMNSGRGNALKTLMRDLSHQDTQETNNRRWGLLEYVAEDPSTTLRAGAIEQLFYILNNDRERAISLFERMMVGHPELLRSHYTQEFLYYGIYKYFARMKPFIEALMNGQDEMSQQRGAELACIAMLSPLALESDQEHADAKRLADIAISGRATWRRGAARVYTHNITSESSKICIEELYKLLDDEDVEVRRSIIEVFSFLRGDHMISMRQFLNAYASSRSIQEGMDQFAEYLWEYGQLDPRWSLSVVEIILNNEQLPEDGPWLSGSEELTRLALRIHTDQTVEPITRRQAMDVFDKLMELSFFEAQRALEEWDRT
jgi:hypothetical protein